MLPATNNHPEHSYYRPADGNRLLVGISTGHRVEEPAPAADMRLASLTADTDHCYPERERQLQFIDLGEPVSWEIEKVGLTGHSADGRPIMGAIPGVEGLMVAGAFHSGGFAYNPGAGYVMAELILDGRSSVEMGYYSPARFQDEDAQKFLAERILERDLQHASGQQKRH